VELYQDVFAATKTMLAALPQIKTEETHLDKTSIFHQIGLSGLSQFPRKFTMYAR
jgi:hypothetical protein